MDLDKCLTIYNHCVIASHRDGFYCLEILFVPFVHLSLDTPGTGQVQALVAMLVIGEVMGQDVGMDCAGPSLNFL